MFKRRYLDERSQEMQSWGKNKKNQLTYNVSKERRHWLVVIHDWMVSMATKRNFKQRKELFTGIKTGKINFLKISICIWHYSRHFTSPPNPIFSILPDLYVQCDPILKMRLEKFAQDNPARKCQGQDSKTGLFDWNPWLVFNIISLPLEILMETNRTRDLGSKKRSAFDCENLVSASTNPWEKPGCT